jgi:3-hydroxyacyl-[acyl-carrier-protein] dehydratase
VRFLHFDRVVSLEPGRRIEAVKAIGLSEEFFRGHFPRRPLVPGALLVEAMVQAAGWLVVATHGFAVSPLFSMLEDATLPPALGPGHRVDLVGELLSTNARGSAARAWASVEGERIATLGRVLFGHYPAASADVMKDRFRYYGGVLP